MVQAILGKPVFLASTRMSACFFPSGLNMVRNGEATTVSIIQRHIIEKEHWPWSLSGCFKTSCSCCSRTHVPFRVCFEVGCIRRTLAGWVGNMETFVHTLDCESANFH